MICRSCACGNDPGSTVCRECGAGLSAQTAARSGANGARQHSYEERIAEAETRLAALSHQLLAVEAEREAIAQALALARLGPTDFDADARVRPSTNAPANVLDAGSFRIIFGGEHGTRVESGHARPAAATTIPFAGPRMKLPDINVRPNAARAVYAAFAADNTRIVSIAADAGTGVTTMLAGLAATAADAGFVAGALYIADARGPAADVAQRLAQLAHPGAMPTYYTLDELQQKFTGVAALVLLDRAKLTAAEQTELCAQFPSLRWVIAHSPAASSATIELGVIDAAGLLMLVEEGYGRRIEGVERAAALAVATTVGSFPASVRLIGIAAAQFGRSFAALHTEFGTGSAIVAALIAGLRSDEQRVLGIVALVPTLLTADDIAVVDGRGDSRRCLERLTDFRLIAASGYGDGYESSRDVASLIPALDDAAAILARTMDALDAALRSATALPPGDRQLAATESLLGLAFERSQWPHVLALGPLLAQQLALRGEFGAWGRVLNLVAAAAKRVNDGAALCLARHELGVRSLLLGEHHKAATLLRSAARDREHAADEAGASATSAVLALLTDELATLDVSSRPIVLREVSMPPETLADPGRGEPGKPRPGRKLRRVVGFGLPALAVALLAIWFWVRPAPAAITEFTTDRALIVAGSTARLCVHATGAALIEIAPDVGPLRAEGKQCVTVAPATTTTYTAIASGTEGQDVRRTVTVGVRAASAARPVRIDAFSARPTRITLGQSARLCYAVSGAEILRIVPAVGMLMQLSACRTITPTEARGYTFKLIAIGESGQIAMRQTRLEAIAAPSPAVQPSAPTAALRSRQTPVPLARERPRAADPQLAQRAIYQFDITPATIDRGQAASLCVGVGRWAQGVVTGIGALPHGITRCYRVRPTATTIYRLHVVLDGSVAVETLTLAVRPHAHVLARDANR